MALNSFSSGVNTSFSTQLNQNFEWNKYKFYTQSLTSSTTTGTSVLWSCTVPANTFSNALFINLYGYVESQYTNGYGTLSLYLNGSVIREERPEVDSNDVSNLRIIDWTVVRNSSVLSLTADASIYVQAKANGSDSTGINEISVFGW